MYCAFCFVIDAPITMDVSTVPVEQQSSTVAPITMYVSTIPVEQQSSTVAPVIEHLTGQLEIHVDQVTYQLVQEGTSSTCDPTIEAPIMNTDDASPDKEQVSALNDAILEDPTEQVETVTYQILEKGTRRARAKLIDSNGYTYNVKSQMRKGTYWQCTVRPKLNRCKATVVQRGDVFCQGNYAHNHCAKTGAAAAEKIAMIVKKEAVNSPLKSAATIVNEVSKPEILQETPAMGMWECENYQIVFYLRWYSIILLTGNLLGFWSFFFRAFGLFWDGKVSA